METWKILTISLLAAVAIGAAGGVGIGKILVKRARSNRKPLLSKKERIAYAVCLLLGAASILFGVFYQFPSSEGMMPSDSVVIDEGGATVQPQAQGAGAVRVRPRRVARA